MIEKFCRMDMGRAEALDSKRKHLHEAIVKQQVILVNVYEEKKALELLLERTGQLYRQAHLERRHLVSTWKDAVNQMNQREKEIQVTEIEIVTAKKITADKRASLEREEMLLKLKQDENRETELYIQELNITSSELRNRLLRLEDSIALKSSELLALRKSVQHESQKLNDMRSENRQMLKEEKDRENHLIETNDELKMMREKFDKFKNNNSNAQERLKQIEEMLEAEIKNKRKIQDEADRLCSALFRSQQQLKRLQEADQNLALENQALEAGIARTRASCKSLEKELLRQTEILYNVDYNIQHAEMRLASMKGTVDEEETKRLDNRRRRLEKIYEDKVKADEMMKAEIEKIEEDMRKLSTVYQNSIAEFDRLHEQLKEKKISVDGGEKQRKILNQQNQEKLVEQNLLKIRISQMEKQIAKQTDKAYSLERHKMELEAAMTDRLIDIKSQTNLLTMKRKCLIEARSQLKMDVADRLLKIEQLKKRYELSMDLLGKNEDGTTVSAVQIKIEMAQEKYLLLNKGNELNGKILKMEDENRRCENTIKLMNFSNDEYRKVFETVTESSPEVIKMNELRSRYVDATNEIKAIKEQLVELVDRIELLDNQRQGLEKEYEEVQRTKLDNNDALLKIHKELVDQDTKLERADREMKTAFKAAKKRIKDSEFINIFLKDMLLKERDERNNCCLQQLTDLVEMTPDMGQTVTRHFLERGLSLPLSVRRGKSQCSWKSDTSQGDQSLKSDIHCMKRCKLKRFLQNSIPTFLSNSRFASFNFVRFININKQSIIEILVKGIIENYKSTIWLVSRQNFVSR